MFRHLASASMVFSRHREDVRNVPLTGTAAFGNRLDGGTLGMRWALLSYLVDQTPPAGALHFELLRDRDSNGYAVRVSYIAQTLDQMRQAVQHDRSHPPEQTTATIEGCTTKDGGICAWATLDALASNVDHACVVTQ